MGNNIEGIDEPSAEELLQMEMEVGEDYNPICAADRELARQKFLARQKQPAQASFSYAANKAYADYILDHFVAH